MKYRITFLETLLLASFWLAAICSLYFVADWFLADDAASISASEVILQ